MSSNTIVLLSNSNIHEPYVFDWLKYILKPGMRVLCFAYASDIGWQMESDLDIVTGEERQSMYYPFYHYGINHDDFVVAPLPNKRNISYLKQKIETSDVIFFRGGFMENIIFLLKSAGLWELLKSQEDKIFIGASAGALVLEDMYQVCPFVEDDYINYQKEEGLGLTKGLNILVHFKPDNWGHRFNLTYMTLTNPRRKVIALGENGGIIYFDRGRYHLIGETYTIL